MSPTFTRLPHCLVTKKCASASGRNQTTTLDPHTLTSETTQIWIPLNVVTPDFLSWASMTCSSRPWQIALGSSDWMKFLDLLNRASFYFCKHVCSPRWQTYQSPWKHFVSSSYGHGHWIGVSTQAPPSEQTYPGHAIKKHCNQIMSWDRSVCYSSNWIVQARARSFTFIVFLLGLRFFLVTKKIAKRVLLPLLAFLLPLLLLLLPLLLLLIVVPWGGRVGRDELFSRHSELDLLITSTVVLFWREGRRRWWRGRVWRVLFRKESLCWDV